jgi:L-ascorbate metabolism protein UlaG (beta-lactamase superfamily)
VIVVIIRWFGECSFLFQDSLGRRIITDPFDVATTIDLLSLNPKIITLSHEHIPMISSFIKNKDTLIINSNDKYKLDFTTVVGYGCFHDQCFGIKRGNNIIYTFLLDNIKICHLGHLGHLLSDELIESLGEIDILLIPIGGHFTLNGKDASVLARRINPRIVIPMYYKIDGSLSYLDNPQFFLTAMDNVLVHDDLFINTDLLEITMLSRTVFLKKKSTLS